MAGIFVGYARQERTRVLPIVRALESLGVSVWWDAELTPGQNFEREIESQLRDAQKILIFWSEAGAESRWLRAEARIALELGRLVQIRLDQAHLPVEFSVAQSLDFSHWVGDLRSPEFLRLLAIVAPDKVDAVAHSRGDRQENIAETAAWAVAQSVNSAEAYQAFLRQHGAGAFAQEAKRRLSLGAANISDSNIFISYRRGESIAVARLIYEHIKEKTKTKQANIFFDVTSIAPGLKFRDYIRERLIKCSTMIAIIGADWAGAKGVLVPRIRSPRDFVRMEVETALELGLRIIPVLTDMKHLPNAAKLPRTVRQICEIQAASLDLGKSYDTDISLIAAAATNTVRQ